MPLIPLSMPLVRELRICHQYMPLSQIKMDVDANGIVKITSLYKILAAITKIS